MPVSQFEIPEKYEYLSGLSNTHQFEGRSEALPETLPVGQNSPQNPKHGLVAEKLSGSPFTVPRHRRYQSWLYRIVPTAVHEKAVPHEGPSSQHRGAAEWTYTPDQIRWDPFAIPEQKTDWIAGLQFLAGSGSPMEKTGFGIFIYGLNANMAEKTAYTSSDGDLLMVPQDGALDIQTEFGRILLRPLEIAVIPRGVRYRVTLVDEKKPARGYALELYQGHFELPELGVIGSNGLANPRDFQIPVAHFEEDLSRWTVVDKYAGQLFDKCQNHTPFDVVAWQGTNYPFKYDLGRFNTIGSISYDHPDPSIFTVLTAPTAEPGTAVVDFAIFPPRWLVQEDTFRPPYFHRNVMSEFMGLICGDYDAKEGGGFQPGGASLHNVMNGHGPDTASYEKATAAELKPMKVGEGAMAFMFETYTYLGLTKWGLDGCQKRQPDYHEKSWLGFQPRFQNPTRVIRE